MKKSVIPVWFLCVSLAASPAAFGLAPLPANWPNQLEIGMGDAPGGAAAMKANTAYKFRYQYLAGGANTGSGWTTWNSPAGAFATFYIQDSVNNGIIPVFTYYMMLQSSPAGGSNESQSDLMNMNNAGTMASYFNDLKIFFQSAKAASSGPVVLHLEPDLWGYIEQAATNDNAATVPAKVAASGVADLAGLPDNAAGFAQAIVKLRNLYGPNVVLAYHLSFWGTGNDLSGVMTGAQVDALSTRSANFYKSLGAAFDLSFVDLSDRDAAYKQAVYGDGGGSWYNAAKFAQAARYLSNYSTLTNTRMVVWQLPMGNTIMRAENNTTHHWQDNRVEWLLNDSTRANLNSYIQAGVVAFLFGAGDGNGSTAGDSGDGITNPPAIAPNPLSGDPNPNNTASQSAPAGTLPSVTTVSGTPTLVTPYASDDDGGFFRWRAWAYYNQGAIAFTGTPPPPPPAAPKVPAKPKNLRSR